MISKQEDLKFCTLHLTEEQIAAVLEIAEKPEWNDSSMSDIIRIALPEMAKIVDDIFSTDGKPIDIVTMLPESTCRKLLGA